MRTRAEKLRDCIEKSGLSHSEIVENLNKLNFPRLTARRLRDWCKNGEYPIDLLETIGDGTRS